MTEGAAFKTLTIAVISAGILDKMGITQSANTSFAQRVQDNLVRAGVNTTLNVTISGEKLKDAAKSGVASAVLDSVTGAAAEKIGVEYKVTKFDPVVHKLLHGLLGGATGAFLGGKDGALAGALGAILAELAAEVLKPEMIDASEQLAERKAKEGHPLTDEESQQVLDEVNQANVDAIKRTAEYAKIAAVVGSMFTGQNTEIAMHTATTALENNFTFTAMEELFAANQSPDKKDEARVEDDEQVSEGDDRIAGEVEVLSLPIEDDFTAIGQQKVVDLGELPMVTASRVAAYASKQVPIHIATSSHHSEHNPTPVTFQFNRDEYLQAGTFESAVIGIGRSAASAGQTAKRFYLQGGAKLGLVDQADVDAYIRTTDAERALYRSTPVAHSFAGQAGEFAMDLGLCYTPARIAGIGFGSIFRLPSALSALGESGITLANRAAGFATTRTSLINTALGVGTLGAWTIFSAGNGHNPYIQSDTSTMYRNTQNPEVSRDFIRGLMSTPPVATPPPPHDEDIFDRMIKCDGYGKFSRIKGTDYWATIDTYRHGGAYWKIYKQMNGQLIHQHDTDELFNIMNKNKGPKGKTINPSKQCRGIPGWKGF